MENKKEKVNGYKVVSVVIPKDMYDNMVKECELAGEIKSVFLRKAIPNEIIFRGQRRLVDEWSKLVRK